MRRKEISEKKAEEECDKWFNEVRPVTVQKRTCTEKRLDKEEHGSETDSSPSADEAKEDTVDVNMVFQLQAEFCLPESEVVQLTLEAERAVLRSRKNSVGT